MVAVITGASGGIGKETAKELVKAGYEVICLSRTPCDADKVKSVKCDITKNEDIEAAFSKIDKVDLLINNAGFGVSGSVEFTDMAEIKAQFELNYFAQISVIKAAIPLLRQSRGRIINISSAASVFAIPFQSFYSATKASVESLTCALNNELSMFGISVCAVRLGDVKTGFTAARRKNFRGDDVYAGMIAKSVKVMENDEINGIQPLEIAKAIVKTAQKKKLPLITTVGAKYKLLCTLEKILPCKTVNKIVGSMYMPRK